MTDLTAPFTYLFVPADRPERYAKALASGADRVIIDLEDAVLDDNKSAGRTAIRQAIDITGIDWQRVVVRVNDVTSGHFEADAALLREMSVRTVMIPKATSAATLQQVADALGGDSHLLPQIESVQGLFAMPELLARDDVARLVFGHLDFALDLGSGRDHEAMLYARSQIVLHSRFAGKAAPVDSVTPEFRVETACRRDAEAAHNLGFGGKLLIHPAQVAPVRGVFAPSESNLAWARRVIAVVEEGGRGAVAVDGQMVDKPVEEAARRMLLRSGQTD